LAYVVATFARAGFQCATHATGDRGVREALDAYRKAGAAPLRGRHRIEHIETLQPHDLPRFAAEGVVASTKPLDVGAYSSETIFDRLAKAGVEAREYFINVPSAAIWGERMRPYVGDASEVLSHEVAKGRAVLFEGAQGTLLDIDHGTYPYVTSSNTVAGNAAVGAGLGPTAIHSVIGITKAYTTRVGNGPLPTELNDATGERLRAVGAEYGATTGRDVEMGFRRGRVLSCSAFEDPTAIACGRRCLDRSFRVQWPPALPVLAQRRDGARVT